MVAQALFSAHVRAPHYRPVNFGWGQDIQTPATEGIPALESALWQNLVPLLKRYAEEGQITGKLSDLKDYSATVQLPDDPASALSIHRLTGPPAEFKLVKHVVDEVFRGVGGNTITHTTDTSIAMTVSEGLQSAIRYHRARQTIRPAKTETYPAVDLTIAKGSPYFESIQKSLDTLRRRLLEDKHRLEAERRVVEKQKDEALKTEALKKALQAPF